MKSRRTREFREAFNGLPRQAQKQAAAAYELFKQDPSHPDLRFKLIDTDSRLYSARIGKSYRALGIVRGDSIVWFWIGSHADHDRFISKW